MFAISRKQVRTLRTVFRRIGDSSSLRTAIVNFTARPGGLQVQCRAGAWAVEQRFEGRYESVELGIPLAALADFEGSSRDDVKIGADGAESVVVQWTDAGVPQQKKYRAVDITKSPPFEAPVSLCQLGDFAAFEELAEVCRSTAKDASRFVLNCIQLRGQRGQAIATDGIQLLVSSGFSFPWKDDVLIPRTRLFEAKEFAGRQPTFVARTDNHVIVRIGDWTLWAPIEKGGRFPDIDPVIPAASEATTSIQLAAADAAFLVQSIPRMPGAASEHSPVTIHCNGHVAVRAKDSESAAATELSLDGSGVAGDEVLVVTNRNHLARAASLGMKSIHFQGADAPVLGTSERRVFVWKPLNGDAVPPDENVACIHSGTPPCEATMPKPIERIPEPMTQTVQPEQHVERSAPVVEDISPERNEPAVGEPSADPIQEVEAIKGVLRDALFRANRLGALLRRRQRQDKLVKSTLLSLRQLGDVG